MMVFGLKEASSLLKTAFAPWVTELGLKPAEFGENSARFLMPDNRRLVHAGGVVCGQATAAAADTCSVVALSAANGRFRVCTTVDLTTHFIRPLPPGDVEIRIDILSNGRKMAFTRAEMFAAGNAKPAVSSTMAFAYLAD